MLDLDVMSSAAAAHLVEAGIVEDEVGPLAERVALVVLLDDMDAAARVAAAQPACVVIGIAPRGRPLPASPPDLDVLLTDVIDAPAPWVSHAAGTDDALAAVLVAIEHAPLAATTLVQLLRVGRNLDVADALVAESLAYSTLQSGPELQAWLASAPRRARAADAHPPVVVERRGSTLSITLNRPAVRNAYSAAMRDGLVDALRLASLDASITAVEVCGAGAAFCSGGDLDEFGTLPDPATAHVIRTSRSAGRWIHQCRDRVTFHVHGACVGAGIELPAFADRVVATEDATFRLPEVHMGLVPGAGGTASIPRRIGRQRTAWLALTGAAISAATAHQWNLVDEIVPSRSGSV